MTSAIAIGVITDYDTLHKKCFFYFVNNTIVSRQLNKLNLTYIKWLIKIKKLVLMKEKIENLILPQKKKKKYPATTLLTR